MTRPRHRRQRHLSPTSTSSTKRQRRFPRRLSRTSRLTAQPTTGGFVNRLHNVSYCAAANRSALPALAPPRPHLPPPPRKSSGRREVEDLLARCNRIEAALDSHVGDDPAAFESGALEAAAAAAGHQEHHPGVEEGAGWGDEEDASGYYAPGEDDEQLQFEADCVRQAEEREEEEAAAEAAWLRQPVAPSGPVNARQLAQQWDAARRQQQQHQQRRQASSSGGGGRPRASHGGTAGGSRGGGGWPAAAPAAAYRSTARRTGGGTSGGRLLTESDPATTAAALALAGSGGIRGTPLGTLLAQWKEAQAAWAAEKVRGRGRSSAAWDFACAGGLSYSHTQLLQFD
jgi:hypothetical protein